MEDLEPPDSSILTADLNEKLEQILNYVNVVIVKDMGYSPKQRIEDLLEAQSLLTECKNKIKNVPPYYLNKDYEEHIRCKEFLIKGLIPQKQMELEYACS